MGGQRSSSILVPSNITSFVMLRCVIFGFGIALGLGDIKKVQVTSSRIFSQLLYSYHRSRVITAPLGINKSLLDSMIEMFQDRLAISTERSLLCGNKAVRN